MASINTKRKNISFEFLKKTSGYIAGATGDYISDVMPTSSSTILGAKNTLQELNSSFSNTSGSILSKIGQLKVQNIFKNVNNWFMQKENSFDDFDSNDSMLDFDIATDNSSEIVEAQISEWNKNANQISKAVIESSHKLAESQLTATANLLTAADRQTAVISSGFDKTNETLNKILEVVTKNTATLIETSVASNSDKSSNDKLASGKFNLSEYKKMVSENSKNSEFGMIQSMVSMFSGNMITPKDVIQWGISKGVNKIAPNFKKNAQALDSAINDVIMGSLIRLGEHRNEFSMRGKLAQIFGIDSSRKTISTERSSLELKPVAFDSVAKEALTGALPGYMRHILIALGGPDLTYDFKSRSFKSKAAITKDFRNQSISSTRGSLNNADNDIKRSLGNDNFSHMLYDLMMNDLGSKNSNGEARNTISKFGNNKETQEYILQTVLAGMTLSQKEIENAKKFANSLGKVTSNGINSHNIMNQVSRNNVSRNNNMKDYINNAESYGMDLSFISDSNIADKKAIAKSYGKDISSSADSKASIIDPTINLKGSNYTNMALYEIYRRLNEGINVFQVGKANIRRKPFEKFGDDYLNRPIGHRPKQTKSSNSSIANEGNSGFIHDDGSANLLENQTNETGASENLSRGGRFTRWGKQRGGNLAKAMFSGNPEQVKEAFGLIVRDVTEIGGSQIKKGLVRVNDSFGNISGFIKHKLFGTGYSYDSGETDKDGNAVKITIKDNENKGVFGFVKDNLMSMFKNSKNNTMKWYNDVISYFDYKGTGTSKDENGMKSKRKNFMTASVGAMAGAGMLGGPMGLLFGAVAGNALSAAGIGNDIKELLFGKDYEDKKGNKKHKLGLMERALNGVVDPIKYQLGKNLNILSKQMKKNVLGPLSDIGFALKERITNTAGEVAQTHFGKVLSFIGKAMMAPFKFGLSAAKLPINMLGSMFGSSVKTSGAIVGAGLNLTASALAGETRKDENGNIIGGRGLVNKRAEDRNRQIEEDYKDDYKDGYSSWKTKQDDRRRQTYSNMEKYTEEEMVESNKNIEEHSAEIAESTGTLARLGSEEGSIFTHDAGLHTRIDDIIGLIGRVKKGPSIDDKNFVNSIIGATGNMMSGDGVVSDEESRLGTGLIEEAAKPNPSKSSVISKFKSLIGIQSKRKDDKENKQESFWDKILKNWKLIAAGALVLFNDKIIKTVESMVKNFTDSGKELWDYIVNGNDKGDNSNAPLNAATAPFDMRTNYASNYLNPLADISHVQKDAAGNDISNINATRAKDAPLYHLAAQGITRGTASVGYNIDKNNHLRLADKASKNNLNLAANKQTSLANAAESRSKQLGDNLFGKGGASVGRGIGNFGIGLAGGQAIGAGAGWLTSTVLKNNGANEVWAERGGRVAETVGTVGGTYKIIKSASTEKGYVKWAIDHILKLLKSLGNQISTSKYFMKAAGPVKEFIEKLGGKVTEKALTPFIGVITKLMAKVGVQVGAGAATLGVANVVMAGAGAISQGCNTENLFGVRSDDADELMTSIAVGLGAVFNLPFVCLIELVDLILAPVNDGKGVRQTLAEIIYNTFENDDGASLSEKQGVLKSDVDDYNKKFGTSLNRSTYNDMTNKGMLDKIWNGGTKTDADGKVMFDDKTGARLTNGGMSKLWGLTDKVNNEYTWATNKIGDGYNKISNKASELWSGKILLDENGKEIKDEDGNPVREDGGGLKNLGLKALGKFNSTASLVFTGISGIAKDWISGEYERDVDGNPIKDENGDPIRKGFLRQWGFNGLAKVVTSITDSVNGVVKGVDDFIDNESAWAKASISSAGQMIVSKVSSFYKSITSPLDDFIDGAKEWLSETADWAKDGVKTYVKDKANKIWDMIKSPYEAIIAKAEQEKKDQASLGTGGGLDEFRSTKYRLGGMGGPVDEGGNPLNKKFDITSPFGERIHPISGERTFHKGIDMVPADGSGEAQIGAKFPGTVSAVGFQSGGAGNYVFYNTPDGKTIKYMHMKNNSIPSNVKVGSSIKPGDKIGDMGTTGGSTGPHLHYQMEQNGQPIDPTSSASDGKMMSSFHGSSPGGNSSSSSAGPLASLLGSIKNAGSAYLNKISGGLLGTSSSNDSSFSSSSGRPGGYVPGFNGLTGSDVPEKVYNFLRSKGCSHEAAIGILANMHQESGIDPTREQVGGPAKGIVQWEGGRLNELRSFAASKGKDWTDLECQLEFLWKELNSADMDGRMSGSIAPGNLSDLGIQGHPKGFQGFKTTNDAKYATALFEGAFERAGTPMMENRYGAIPSLDQRLKGKGGGLDEIFSGLKNKITNKIRDKAGNNWDSKINIPINYSTNNSKFNSPESSTFVPKDISNNNSIIPKINDMNNQPSQKSNNNIGLSTETSTLESLLSQVLTELKAINGNTGESSNLLVSLNQKDFVDTGVRETLTNFGKAKPRKPQSPYNHGNTRAISAMIRP